MASDKISKTVFQCEFGRGLLRKITGNEKEVYLEVTKTEISGKAVIYPENTRNSYSYISDFNYDIGTITKIEKTVAQGLTTFVIYVSANTIYGREKYQLHFPGMKDIEGASSMLRDLLEANQGGAKPLNSQLQPPVPKAVTPPPSAPAQGSEATKPAAEAPVQTPETSVQTPEAATPTEEKTVQTPAAAETVQNKPDEPTLEERRKQYEKLEAIYQTGMISEKEYKTSKAEYISYESGLDEFYNKLKINIQYSEIGFLSEKEFENFKKEVIEEASEIDNVSTDAYKQNLKKLLLLNLCEILSNDEYGKICDDIVSTVQYVSDDPEELVVQKIERWPVLKECEILTSEQYDQFLNIVADDTKIKMGESIPILEHKLIRLTTLSKTFIFTPEEFAKKQQEFIAEMTEIDYSSDTKLAAQVERLMALKRCEWMDESAYQAKKDEVLKTIGDNGDAVQKMLSFKILTEADYITQADYNNFKKGVIDDIFSNYSDIDELRMRAQTLMGLKEAGIVADTEFSDLKKKLLAL